MPAVCIQRLGVRLPVVDYQLVVNIKPHSIVPRDVELVVTGFLREKISSPAHRKVIDGLAIGKTSFLPLKSNVRIGTCQYWSALQFFVWKIFSLQAGYM